MKSLCIAALCVSSAVSTAYAQTPTEEKNSFGGPKLEVPKNIPSLQIQFEEEGWGDKRIAPKMQCARNGGDKPASPKMSIDGAPEGTSSLIVYVLNEPPSWDNHGLFRVMPATDRDAAKSWVIPSIGSNRELDKLTKRVRPYAGGNSWGRVYSAPCPSGGSWRYTVAVFAVDDEDKVLAYGKTIMGYAP